MVVLVISYHMVFHNTQKEYHDEECDDEDYEDECDEV